MIMPKVLFISEASDHMEAEYFIDLLRMRLIEIRRKQNMTQNELAKRMYCSTSTVSDFERGEKDVTLQWVFEECSALGLDAIHFLIGVAFTTLKHFHI